ncbi:TPA: hypothetical protein ACH3X1_003126 [Trebouxia sp. C0004]
MATKQACPRAPSIFKPNAWSQKPTSKPQTTLVDLKELHPELSYRQIGSKIGKSQTFASKWIRPARLHNSVADQPRSGRPHKLNAKAIQLILVAAKQKQCKSAAAITARIQQKSVLKVSVSTVQRALRREGPLVPVSNAFANEIREALARLTGHQGFPLPYPMPLKESDLKHLRPKQHLVPEGKRLFQQAGRRADKWKLQQDNAPAHKTKENMQCVSDNVQGGLFLEWLPNSPDLSPIENL